MLNCEKDLLFWIMVTVMAGLSLFGSVAYLMDNKIIESLIYLFCCWILIVIFERWIRR